MRFIKAHGTNLRNIAGTGFKYDGINQYGIVDTTQSLLLAKGTETEKPTTPENGIMRYNTTSNEFEFYQNGAWRKVRFKEPNTIGIYKETIGTGDATETVFGPLNTNDPDFPVPQSADHLIVLVENVMQISTTNFTLEQSVSGNLAGPNSPYADGWYIKFTSPPDLAKDITVYHNFDK